MLLRAVSLGALFLSSPSMAKKVKTIPKCSACGAIVQELLILLEKELTKDGMPTAVDGEVLISFNELQMVQVVNEVCTYMKV